jgi:hypothetical protein
MVGTRYRPEFREEALALLSAGSPPPNAALSPRFATAATLTTLTVTPPAAASGERLSAPVASSCASAEHSLRVALDFMSLADAAAGGNNGAITNARGKLEDALRALRAVVEKPLG